MKSKILSWVVYLTVFTSSMAIMFLQLVGGRVIAQYLGQSLYTWTSIIATTLAGIAIGNHIGGILADKYTNTKSIPIQFFIAAISIFIIPFINQLLGNWELLQGLVWEWRILIHILFLFLPPFIILGTVSPVLTHLLILVSPKYGTSVGIFFGFSLLGSLIGTFLTGYVLLAHFSYITLLAISSSLLLLISLAYFAGGYFITSNAIYKEKTYLPEHKGKSRIIDIANFPPFYKLLIISFWAGASVMVIETVASRLLARSFGNSLYTWTGIIGVELGALSIGGYIGGYLGQYFNPRKVSVCFLFLSSICTLFIPLINTLLPMTPILWNLSWPMQILTHSIIVFGPACVAFGALSPLLVELILPDEHGEVQGKKIGMTYAMNAIGGILGVLITGYYAIAYLGSNLTLAIVMLLTTLFFLWFSRRSLLSIAYTMLVVVLFLSTIAPEYPWDSLALQLALKPYHPKNVIYEKESHYNYIKVQTPDPERPYLRDLILDKMIHNRKDMSQPLKLLGVYEYFFNSVLTYSFKEKPPERILVIGGGGYTFCNFLEHKYPECRIEVAEIDPEVTKAAHVALGLPEDTHLAIYHQDGRNRVEDIARDMTNTEDKKLYDCVINDSFSDYTVPFHLTTKEFVEKISKILSPNGIYMCNTIDCLTYAHFLTTIYKTCKEVFPYLYVFYTTNDPTARDTIIIVSSKQVLPPEDIKNWVIEQYGVHAYYLPDEKMEELIAKNKPKVLTDQYAPVENLLAPMVSLTEETPYFRRLGYAIKETESGQMDKGIEEIIKIVNERPNFNEAYLVLAETLIEANRFAEAVPWAKKLIQQVPQEVKGYVVLGTAYAHLGDTMSAIAVWEKALKMDPNLLNIKVNLSSLLIQQNQFEAAEKLLKEVQEKDSSLNVAVLSNLASLYFSQGKWNESLKELLQLEQIQPQNYFIKEQLAIVYHRLGNIEKARELVHECQKANYPVNPQFLQIIEQDTKQ